MNICAKRASFGFVFFLRCAIARARGRSDSNKDMPTAPFPDAWLLGGDYLAKLGRSGAVDLFKSGAVADASVHGGPEECVVVRRSMYQWDREAGEWRRRSSGRVTAASAKAAVALPNAKTEAELVAALGLAGFVAPLHHKLPELCELFRDYKVVLLNERAQRYWRMPPPPGVGPHSNASALCAFCTVAAVHGVCEHIYAVLMCQSVIEPDQGDHPARRGGGRRPKASQAQPVEPECGSGVIQDRRRSRVTSHQHQDSAEAPSASVGDQVLRRWLVECSIGGRTARAILESGLDAASLHAWSVSDLVSAFGPHGLEHVPAGRLRAKALSWLASGSGSAVEAQQPMPEAVALEV